MALEVGKYALLNHQVFGESVQLLDQDEANPLRMEVFDDP